MGKYFRFSARQDIPVIDSTEALVLTNQYIANELVEANRLKRIELMMTFKDKPNGWYEDLIDEYTELNGTELEDKA